MMPPQLVDFAREVDCGGAGPKPKARRDGSRAASDASVWGILGNLAIGSRKWRYCVMAQSHREAARRLFFEIAEQQQGFFTTKQAKAAGFAESTHPYHVQAVNWIREHRGIYRLALFPTTDRPGPVLWHCGPGTGTRQWRGCTDIRRRLAFTTCPT
jgi:hypothetical protein